MKIEFDRWGGFVIEPENGGDELALEAMLKGIEKDDRAALSKYLSVDFSDACLLEDDRPARDMTLDKVFETDKANNTDFVWGEIKRVTFTIAL